MKKSILSQTLFISFVVLTACSDDDGDDPKSLDSATQGVLDAQDARCAQAIECYGKPEDAQSDCEVPSENGATGWSQDTGEELEREMNCLSDVYAKEPDALIAYLECTKQEVDVVTGCLKEQACPDDASDCLRKADQDRCDREAPDSLLEAFGEC